MLLMHLFYITFAIWRLNSGHKAKKKKSTILHLRPVIFFSIPFLQDTVIEICVMFH